MNDKQISAFISVAECGSFSAAARKQYISPQAIIQQIDLLENEIGSKLFVRNHRGVTLSNAGKVYYNGIIKLTNMHHELLHQVHILEDSEKNALRIGLFDTHMMNTVCKAFSEKYPQVKQEYTTIATDAWLDILQHLFSNRLDIVEHADCPEVHQPGLVFEYLQSTGTYCALSATHPLAKKKELLPADLSGMLISIHSRKCVPGLEELLAREAAGSLLIDGEKSTSSAFDICSKGGVFLFPENSLKRFIPLQIIPFKCDLTWRFGLVYRENPSKNTQLFIETARQVFYP